jgi:integrase
MLKSWPDLASREIRRISPELCREWATRYAAVASDNRYNNSVSLLRHIFDVAIEHAVIYTNPAKELERVTVRGKKLDLPTLKKFGEFIAEMRRAHSRDSKNCADLTEGLAYTGMRIGESAEVKIFDVNFQTEELRVSGDPEEGTKNSEERFVPLNPQAAALFKRMIADRADAEDSEPLFLVRECQKSMDRAAKIVGMKRITHHDLRHLFATVCIESGVDIPTVSRWLGHKDGGALAMKTYGHLRREHSVAQAKKVSFTPALAA